MSSAIGSSPTSNSNSASVIPLPPSATIETSSEPPRTLWMGDLDPSFDEITIQQIWSRLNKRVFVKLIRAKKNLLIPCSSTAGTGTAAQQHVQPTVSHPTPASATIQEEQDNPPYIDNAHKININGISFIDPATTQLHHAGYCFVEFESQQDAQSGLSLNSTPLPNFVSSSTGLSTNPSGQRNFRLNWASGATLQSSIPSRPEFSLFVGDLSPSATEADLLSLFQQKFKSVKTVRVMTDPITGASRCFGFVRFGNEEERRRALVEMNGVWCQGRCLRVAYATPRNNMMWQAQVAQVQQQEQQQTPLLVKTANSMIGSTNTQHIAPAPNAGNNNKLLPFSHSLAQKQLSDLSPSSQAYTTDPNNKTVFIGGLTPKINENQLQALFSPFGNILTVKIPQGKNCGFVKFEKRIDAEAAIQGMQGFVVCGSPIRLSWGRNTVSTTPTGASGSNGNPSIFPQYIQQQSFLSNQSNHYPYIPVSHSSSSVSSQPLDIYQNSMIQAQARAQAQAQVAQAQAAQAQAAQAQAQAAQAQAAQAQAAQAQAQAQAQTPDAHAQQMWWCNNNNNPPWVTTPPSGCYSLNTPQQINTPLMYQRLARNQSTHSVFPHGESNGQFNNFVNERSDATSGSITPIPPPLLR